MPAFLNFIFSKIVKAIPFVPSQQVVKKILISIITYTKEVNRCNFRAFQEPVSLINCLSPSFPSSSHPTPTPPAPSSSRLSNCATKLPKRSFAGAQPRMSIVTNVNIHPQHHNVWCHSIPNHTKRYPAGPPSLTESASTDRCATFSDTQTTLRNATNSSQFSPIYELVLFDASKTFYSKYLRPKTLPILGLAWIQLENFPDTLRSSPVPH